MLIHTPYISSYVRGNKKGRRRINLNEMFRSYIGTYASKVILGDLSFTFLTLIKLSINLETAKFDRTALVLTRCCLASKSLEWLNVH